MAKTDAQLIAEIEREYISSARILIQLLPDETIGPQPADLGSPEAGFRWEKDREYLARLERMRAASEA